MNEPAGREEHDLLGCRVVPDRAYYGIHSLRARENFPITGSAISTYPDLVWALGAVKRSATAANLELGLLDHQVGSAIVAACDDVMAGRLDEHFVVDVIQGGAGTSSNMNANEVIANRALEILGHPRGTYEIVHPLEHVNLSQSTNDAYPTAIKVGLLRALTRLDDPLRHLQDAFAAKALEFATLVKMGRTQLQDAVPMTLGQEFGAFAVMVEEDRARLREVRDLLCEINLGGTAIGTRINAHPDYQSKACAALATVSGFDLVPAVDLIEATQDTGVFIQLSAVLKRTALKLSKVCNDLRLLSSGPRAGLNEIVLPARQAGSSIMPGKVNPVIPEVVNQVAFELAGRDVTISFAAEAGQLQLNAFEPIIAHCLFGSIAHLSAAVRALDTHCVRGIRANDTQLQRYLEDSIGVVTALNPFIGYHASTEIAAEALRSGRGVAELVVERGLLTRAQLDSILDPAALAASARMY